MKSVPASKMPEPVVKLFEPVPRAGVGERATLALDPIGASASAGLWGCFAARVGREPESGTPSGEVAREDK